MTIHRAYFSPTGSMERIFENTNYPGNTMLLVATRRNWGGLDWKGDFPLKKCTHPKCNEILLPFDFIVRSVIEHLKQLDHIDGTEKGGGTQVLTADALEPQWCSKHFPDPYIELPREGKLKMRLRLLNEQGIQYQLPDELDGYRRTIDKRSVRKMFTPAPDPHAVWKVRLEPRAERGMSKDRINYNRKSKHKGEVEEDFSEMFGKK